VGYSELSIDPPGFLKYMEFPTSWKTTNISRTLIWCCQSVCLFS